MRDDLQKAESTLAMYIRIERIDLNAYLHSRNISGMNSSQCNCEWSHQMTKHVLMHCLNWSHLRSRMLQDADFSNYQIIIAITKSLKAAARMIRLIIKLSFHIYILTWLDYSSQIFWLNLILISSQSSIWVFDSTHQAIENDVKY